MKAAEQQAAIVLRNEGWTYAAIQLRLGVSKGSLSRWLKALPYTPNPETLSRRHSASIAAAHVLHHRKLQRVAAIQQAAEQSVLPLERQTLHLLGIMAYWAEGSKTQDSLVTFANTDPYLIRLVQRWWIECCDVDPRRLRMHIRVHDDVVRVDAEAYWQSVTGIPFSQWEKTTVKESGSGGRRVRKLRHGIATIKVCDTNFHHRIRGWIAGLAKQLDLHMRP